MIPPQYLDSVREPLAELLLIYAFRKFPAEKSKYTSTIDHRELLRFTLRDLQEKLDELRENKKQEKMRKAIEKIDQNHNILSHQRRLLSFISEILNIYAHDHSHDTQSLALAVSSALSVFARSADLRGSAHWEKLANYEANLYKEVFSEYAEPTDPDSDSMVLGPQIDAVHERLEHIAEGVESLLQLHDSPPPTEQVPQHSAGRKKKEIGQKRKELERIRQEISDTAEQRGRRMEGYQHLLQIWKLDDLMEKSPSNLSELEDWARTLPSYAKNRGWIDRQIKRWGDQIIACLNA